MHVMPNESVRATWDPGTGATSALAGASRVAAGYLGQARPDPCYGGPLAKARPVYAANDMGLDPCMLRRCAHKKLVPMIGLK